MFKSLFKKNINECLGIDIETFSLKIVEIEKKGKQMKLNNYGEVRIKDAYPDLPAGKEKNIITADAEEIASAIREILVEAKIKSRDAVFSLPDYSSFFTAFSLPAMTKEEIPEAVKFEAPIHIPLPLSRVTLDWQVVDEFQKENSSSKILLVAVPNEIVSKYQEIASLAKLNLVALEAEVFGLIRALVRETEPVILVDIGTESTTCSIISNKKLEVSHSFDTGGKKMTEAISNDLNLEYWQAEEMKKENGIIYERNVEKSLIPLLNLILGEVREIYNDFLENDKRKVEKLILSGGSVLLPGLKEYFGLNLNLKTEIGDPFSGLICPASLKGTLNKMGSLYAIPIGVALRGLK